MPGELKVLVMLTTLESDFETKSA